MNHDHRDLARDMGLVAGDPLVGAGLPLWLPAGAAIRHELEQLGRETALASGCRPVYSPVLGKRALFERSGHWEKFADDMFPAMAMGGPEAEDLVLRPANCPHHAMLYAAEQHSYRELPIRYHELAPMFRAERSGVVSGLSRVRQINLDDTHVFARHDQIRDEVALALDAGLDVLGTLGIQVSYVRLSRRDSSDRWLGDPAHWVGAEEQLREATHAVDLSARGIELREQPGEAAFYGPKLDIQVLDAAGREETIATVQLDFGQPERFDLTCVGPDGGRERVVMIHRGLVGSMERMVALLLEVHDGRLPIWLAPVQVCVLPVSQDQQLAADDVAERLSAAGIRVRVEGEGSLGRRLRAARRRRDSLLAVVGPTEVAVDGVTVHDPATDSRAAITVGELRDRLRAAVGARRPRVELG